jgi:hypothetical protein
MTYPALTLRATRRSMRFELEMDLAKRRMGNWGGINATRNQVASFQTKRLYRCDIPRNRFPKLRERCKPFLRAQIAKAFNGERRIVQIALET